MAIQAGSSEQVGTNGNGATLDTGAAPGLDNGVAGGRRDVQQQARDLVSRAGDRARDGLEEQKHRAVSELHAVAETLRGNSTSRESAVAPYLQRVADQVDRFSDVIENRTVEQIARDVEQFARRRPALFLGGCFALGVAAARFLKSSDPNHNLPATRADLGYDTHRTGYGTTGGAQMGYTSGSAFEPGRDR